MRTKLLVLVLCILGQYAHAEATHTIREATRRVTMASDTGAGKTPEQLVADLGSDEFPVREAASTALKKQINDPKIIGALLKGLGETDLEIRKRASDALLTASRDQLSPVVDAFEKGEFKEPLKGRVLSLLRSKEIAKSWSEAVAILDQAAQDSTPKPKKAQDAALKLVKALSYKDYKKLRRDLRMVHADIDEEASEVPVDEKKIAELKGKEKKLLLQLDEMMKAAAAKAGFTLTKKEIPVEKPAPQAPGNPAPPVGNEFATVAFYTMTKKEKGRDTESYQIDMMRGLSMLVNERVEVSTKKMPKKIILPNGKVLASKDLVAGLGEKLPFSVNITPFLKVMTEEAFVTSGVAYPHLMRMFPKDAQAIEKELMPQP